MNIKTKIADVFLNKEGNKELEFKLEKKYNEAKKHKAKREQSVAVNIEALESIGKEYDELNYIASGKLQKSHRTKKFFSPILTTIIEKKCNSAWIPQIYFEPEQKFGDGSDVFLARNITRVHDFLLDKGKFYREARKCGRDVFTKGLGFLLKGWKTKKIDGGERPTILEFRNIKWENVFWTSDEKWWFIVENFTLEELIDVFGEEIKNEKICEGDMFANDTKEINFDSPDEAQKIQVVHAFCGEEKIYICSIGGGRKFYKKLIGENYPWTDFWNNGFVPIDKVQASPMNIGEHPICDVDKIISLWSNYSEIFNIIMERARKYVRAPQIVGIDGDPNEARKLWLKDLAQQRAGVDIPHFMKMDQNKIFTSTLDTPLDISTPLQLREFFLQDIMDSTGVNLRALSSEADTLGQDQLRVKREMATIEDFITLNESNFENMALNNVAMLSGSDAMFLDKYVGIEDEISDDDDTAGILDKKPIREIVDNIDDFAFNVKVSVNGSSSKRREVEMLMKNEAFRTLSSVGTGSTAIAKMAYEIAKDNFPNLKMKEEDFLPEQPPMPNENGTGQINLSAPQKPQISAALKKIEN